MKHDMQYNNDTWALYSDSITRSFQSSITTNNKENQIIG